MSFLFITLSLVLGLYFLRNNIVLSVIFSLVYLTFIFFRFNKKFFLMCLCVFSCGAVLGNLNLEYNSNNNIYSGFVIEVKDNYYLFQAQTEKYYISEKDNSREIGDYLVFKGEPSEIKFTTYESQFNFKDYLYNKGVKRELKGNIIDIKYSSFIKIHAFKKRFLSKFDEDASALVESFLFNEKDYSKEAIIITSELNLMFLLSLSGIYLHLIFSFLTYIFKLKLPEKVAEILPFIILLPFAFFSFSKIGTLRVYALYLLKFVNKHLLKKRFSHVELVSLLALFFLIIDFNLVYQEAFYIGFSLSVLAPYINTSLKTIKKKWRKLIYPLLIHIYILPLTISGGYLHLFSILFTYLLIPFNLIFLILSQISIIIPIFPIINGYAKLLTQILEKIGVIDLKIPISDLGGAIGFILILFFFIALYLLENGRIRHLKNVFCVFSIMVLWSIVPLQDPFVNAVYFVNVGQGDSIIIKNRIYTVMIDTGGYKGCDMAKESLIPFMIKNKISHIDALITTHEDFDHSGAVDSLIKNYKVKKYINSKECFPYKIGDICLNNLNDYSGEDENDASLVLSMNFMNKKWLFMGDASVNIEKFLLNKKINLDCDVLKIGHHGSKTSTSLEFLQATTPDTAIISVGANNYYGHPNSEVLDRLKSLNIKIRRTDKEGTIKYYSLLS